MSARQIAPGVFRTNAGGAGVYLIDGEGVTVIDSGMPGKIDKIMAAVRFIGRSPTDVANVLITHYHQDHIGCLTELADAARAKVYVPKGDGDLIRNGGRAPELNRRGFAGAVLSMFVRMNERPPNRVDFEVTGGDELQVAGGIEVIDTPGHTRGHVAYLWHREGGVLFGGDAAANLLGRLGVMPLCEDFAAAEQSFATLAERDFQVAGFGHGRPILSEAADRFRAAAAA